MYSTVPYRNFHNLRYAALLVRILSDLTKLPAPITRKAIAELDWWIFFIQGGEVPVDKLQALQRVLESEFCTSIREVYEHVYDTVDIGGSPEVRASATAKVRLYECFCVSKP